MTHARGLNESRGVGDDGIDDDLGADGLSRFSNATFFDVEAGLGNGICVSPIAFRLEV